jgi:hypothetical protein
MLDPISIVQSREVRITTLRGNHRGARQFPSYEKLTELVRQHFPTSKWQKTLAKDASDSLVVIELKAGRAKVAHWGSYWDIWVACRQWVQT